MSDGVVSQIDDTVAIVENFFMKATWLEYRRFARQLSAHQLTLPQFHALVAIKENNLKCTMGHLADETGQVSATMTGIIDRLVDRKLVERWRPPNDRRKVLVRLTEAGESKLEAVFKARRNQVTSLLTRLDESTRHSLAFSLKEYMQLLETVS